MSVLGKDLFDFQRSHTNTKVEFGASGYWVEMVPEIQPYGTVLTEILNLDVTPFQKLLDSQRKMQRFRVYQLDLEHGETRAFAFGGIDALHKAGFQQPPAAEYTLVYDGELTCPVGQDERDILERIFARYNQAFPPDYRGRSIAPSDVLELYDESERRYFYCDMAGFPRVKFSPALAKKA